MNFKKVYFSITGVVVGFLVTVQRTWAQVIVNKLGLEYSAQTNYGFFNDDFLMHLYDLLPIFNLTILIVLIVVWIVDIVRFFKRRRAIKKGSLVVDRELIKKQAVHLSIWLLFFVLLFIGDWFFYEFIIGIVAIEFVVIARLYIACICVVFGLFLVLPKLLIKIIIAYLKG